MKKFTFSLQVVLGYKNSIEKKQKAELAKINDIIESLNRRMKDIVARRELSQTELRQRTSGGGQILSEMEHYDRFFERLREEEQAVTEKIEIAKTEKAAIQQQLVVTMREIKSLESLKEEQYLRYMEEVRMEEAKTLEDLISYKTTQGEYDN